jgi:uncharacterized protein
MTDGSYTKPLPRIDDPATAPFWAGLRERRLQMPRCSTCGYVRWPATALCPECLASDAPWVEVPPIGELWSFAVYHRAFHPGFQGDLPYAVGRVVLDAGPSLIAQVISPIHEIRIGSRVIGVFEDVTADVTLLRWTMDGA